MRALPIPLIAVFGQDGEIVDADFVEDTPTGAEANVDATVGDSRMHNRETSVPSLRSSALGNISRVHGSVNDASSTSRIASMSAADAPTVQSPMLVIRPQILIAKNGIDSSASGRRT